MQRGTRDLHEWVTRQINDDMAGLSQAYAVREVVSRPITNIGGELTSK